MELNFSNFAPKILKVQLRDPLDKTNHIVGVRTLTDNYSEVKLNYNDKDELVSVEVINYRSYSVTEIVTEKTAIFRSE